MSGLLIFSATAGYRHGSIPAGVAAARELGEADGFAVEATENDAAFTSDNLSRFAAVVFMNTSGEVLGGQAKEALRSYLASGGGYVGVHLAAGTEYDWPFYGGLVGARFDAHPEVQPATFAVEDRTHPATAHLTPRWDRVDELYNYRGNPRPDVHVLVTLDESSYSGGTMGADHPITWCHGYHGGRAFYTGAGHTVESYAEPAFRTLLLGGLRYAAGTVHADDRPEHGYAVAKAGDVTSWESPRPLGDGPIKFGWRDNGDGYVARVDGHEIRLGEPSPSLNPAGFWNTYQLSIGSGEVVVHLNGVESARVVAPTGPGFVSLGPLDGRAGGPACLRDIRVAQTG